MMTRLQKYATEGYDLCNIEIGSGELHEEEFRDGGLAVPQRRNSSSATAIEAICSTVCRVLVPVHAIQRLCGR